MSRDLPSLDTNPASLDLATRLCRFYYRLFWQWGQMPLMTKEMAWALYPLGRRSEGTSSISMQ